MKKKIDFLYKYRIIDSNLIHILVKNELYFSPPSNFNDPFDSNIIPILSIKRRDVEDYFRRNDPRIIGTTFQKAVDDALRMGVRGFMKSYRRDLLVVRKYLAICCFSAVKNSSIMYSHYANGHKGLCLEFKVTGHKFYDGLMPVQYPLQFPSMRVFKRTRMEGAEKQFTNKQHEWAYEKEWRILKPNGPIGFNKFPPGSLTAIIFGLETSPSDVEIVQEIAKIHNPKISFYRCTKVEGKFDLKIVRLSTKAV